MMKKIIIFLLEKKEEINLEMKMMIKIMVFQVEKEKEAKIKFYLEKMMMKMIQIIKSQKMLEEAKIKVILMNTMKKIQMEKI